MRNKSKDNEGQDPWSRAFSGHSVLGSLYQCLQCFWFKPSVFSVHPKEQSQENPQRQTHYWRIDLFFSKGQRMDSRTTRGCLPSPFVSSPLQSGWHRCRISGQMSLMGCGILSHRAWTWRERPPHLMASGRSLPVNRSWHSREIL